MLPPHDQLPPPIRPRIERTSLPHSAAMLVGTMALIWFAVGLYRWATEPIIVTSSTSGPPAIPASYPPELLRMAVAVSTSLAPTPTPLPPTPTYTMPPTPRPPDVCLTSTPRGSVCTQPLPPLPTSTPMADCPVSPDELCVWGGGPVTWLSPTPSSERTGTGGVNSQ